LSLHSVGWFFMTATSALASIGAGLEGFYLASGCYFVFCDGSVHPISYNVDTRINYRLANRRDGINVQLP